MISSCGNVCPRWGYQTWPSYRQQVVMKKGLALTTEPGEENGQLTLRRPSLPDGFQGRKEHWG